MSQPAPPTQAITASFRDPAGSLFRYQGRVLRVVNAIGVADLEAFLASPAGRKSMAAGAVVPTRALDAAECRELLADISVRELYDARGGQMILEHEQVDFPSFPYEWNAEMLHAAALLTLDLAQALLADGLGLKDGTPYNILFRGPEPVFIDVLSFERRDPGDATWLPYAQFVRTFLLPLLANQAYGLGLDQTLTTRRDGLEPEEVYRWTKPWQRLRPPFFGLVAMPTWLGGKHKQDDTSIYRKKLLSDPEKARYILDHLLNGLRRTLQRLKPVAGTHSVWSDYMTTNNNYTADHFQAKQRFVGEALAEFRSRRVLDVGCNTGHFSAIAARSGAKVVALDYDPVVLGDVWRNARQEKLEILPLAVNVTRPSPGTGWRNLECASFLDRARGKFDAVLMLAVIHHMLVTERVPLADIIDLAAELTTNLLVIEFVAPDDSMFRRLTRGREELHQDLTPELFETLAGRHFEIVRMQYVEGTTRRLYLLRKRT
ncbi:MAG: methyltransferase domain-containing protein [Candidatus Solibacter sp.]|nr:methyltransferase domain-containing protein [Candidatus Solibacter sp.]